MNDLEKDLQLPTQIACNNCGWKIHWLLVRCSVCGASLIRQKLTMIARAKAAAQRNKPKVPLGQYPP